MITVQGRDASFAAVTALALLLVLRAPFSLSGWLIPLGLAGTYWWLSRETKPPLALLVTIQAFILLAAAGTSFDLYNWSLAGATYDTYMHLLGGYCTAALLHRYLARKGWRRPTLTAFTLTLALGLLVEAVEFFETTHTLLYWQDTVKDVVNDALGAALALVQKD